MRSENRRQLGGFSQRAKLIMQKIREPIVNLDSADTAEGALVNEDAGSTSPTESLFSKVLIDIK